MKIKKLTPNRTLEESKKAGMHLKGLRSLLAALENREISDEIIEKINWEVEKVNTLSESAKKPVSKIHTAHQQILEIIRKEMNLTTEKYYTYLWLVLGMSAFGIPMGIILFSILDNPAMISIGIPVGMAVGIFVGMALDKKAKEEGRVLEIDSED